ncbi:MAG TPA: hypothetical protein DCO72_00610 [Ruminococcus sp.]|nr:hypothetical protein [Ruminococcus sp.]
MKRIFSFFMILILSQWFIPLPVHAEENAKAILLSEASTGNVLMEENADTPLPVGSLAKLMTAYLTAKAIDAGELQLDTVLTAGESVTSMSGASIWLQAGDKATVEELLFGILTGNANDASDVLAKAISGDEKNFVMDMNATAFELGMKSTWFTSPQGFDDPDAHSTARDLSKLACAVLQCDILSPYMTTWRIIIREDSTPADLVNENTFTRTMEHCKGLKACHSPECGQCVIASAEQNGLTCIAIVLGCDDEDERFAIAKRLLRNGFSNYKVTVPAFSEEFLQPLTIKGGTENAVLLEVSELPALAVSGEEQLETVIVLPEFMQAPVKKGFPVGMVYFYHEKTLLCEVPLLTADAVGKMTFSHAWGKVCKYLFS